MRIHWSIAGELVGSAGAGGEELANNANEVWPPVRNFRWWAWLMAIPAFADAWLAMMGMGDWKVHREQRNGQYECRD